MNQSLPELAALSRELDERKADYRPTYLGFRWHYNGQAIVNNSEIAGANLSELFGAPVVDQSPPLDITDHAFGQWRERFGPTLLKQSKTLSKADWESIRRVFPDHFSLMGNKLHKMRADQDGDDKTLLVRAFDQEIRAVLSYRYAILDNTGVLDALNTVVQAGQVQLPEQRIVRSSIDEDEMHVRIVFKGDQTLPGGSGDYGFGVYVRNSEIGKSATWVTPMVWRNSCLNSVIVQRDMQTKFRHVGTWTPAGILNQVQVAIGEALRYTPEIMNTIYEASNKTLPNVADILNGLAAEHGWAEKTVEQALIGTEGENTHMGVVNGITYAAQSLTDHMAQADMEVAAGRTLLQQSDKLIRLGQRHRAKEPVLA